ncbi:MAG: RHS repeat domain-containing protein [Enterobacter hormaechei]
MALNLPVALPTRWPRAPVADPRGNLLRLDSSSGAEYRFTYDAVGRPLN